MKAKVIVDGRGNARNRGSCAAVIKINNKIVFEGAIRLTGEPSNNEAEYEAVIYGMKKSIELGLREIEIYSDSQLIVNQLMGIYRIRQSNLQRYFQSAIELASSFEDISINWVPRKFTKHPDSLCREVVKGIKLRNNSSPQKHSSDEEYFCFESSFDALGNISSQKLSA